MRLLKYCTRDIYSLCLKLKPHTIKSQLGRARHFVYLGFGGRQKFRKSPGPFIYPIKCPGFWNCCAPQNWKDMQYMSARFGSKTWRRSWKFNRRWLDALSKRKPIHPYNMWRKPFRGHIVELASHLNPSGRSPLLLRRVEYTHIPYSTRHSSYMICFVLYRYSWIIFS